VALLQTRFHDIRYFFPIMPIVFPLYKNRNTGGILHLHHQFLLPPMPLITAKKPQKDRELTACVAPARPKGKIPQ
jgi:hypothetical protein